MQLGISSLSLCLVRSCFFHDDLPLMMVSCQDSRNPTNGIISLTNGYIHEKGKHISPTPFLKGMETLGYIGCNIQNSNIQSLSEVDHEMKCFGQPVLKG